MKTDFNPEPIDPSCFTLVIVTDCMSQRLVELNLTFHNNKK